MADCVIRIAELKKNLNDEVDAYVEYKDSVRKLVNEACDADCCRLLYLRYFRFETWETIALEMNYSRYWISGELHKRALTQVQIKLDNAI